MRGSIRMKSKKKIFIIIITVIICIGIYLLFRKDGFEFKHSKEAEFAIEFKGTELKEERDGKLIWKLKADRVNIDKDKNVMSIEGAECIFNDNGMSLDVNADSAIFNKNENVLYLKGSIKGHSDDGTSIKAENLKYESKTGILSSDRPFFIEKDGHKLTADSFTADRILKTVKAKGNASLTDRG